MIHLNRVTETDYYSMFNDISLRYNIPVHVVEKICMSQFEFLRESIKGGNRDDATTFKNVRLLGLGLFHFSPGLVKRYKMLREQREHENTVKSLERPSGS